ncbi:hypothetical protein NP493_23g04021 [Ridgeia piscesae]|uniref:Uncharacterized protein n=1 Tax=Ridgeia piscesae TaxID=27915 RepID=A0AAD9PDY1_RIDPI|nr:hypothetical protein NP493_23g04021 [Ridgeia piscesae]
MQAFVTYILCISYLPELLTRKLVSKCGQQFSNARQNSLKASYPFSESISMNTSARWRASGCDRISHSSAYVNTALRINTGSTALTSKSTAIADRCLESRRQTPYFPAILVYMCEMFTSVRHACEVDMLFKVNIANYHSSSRYSIRYRYLEGWACTVVSGSFY